MQPSFPGLYVAGPNNQTISVLTRVNLPDGSSYRFDYTVFGQVSVIRRYAADDHQLAYTSYNLETGAQADCPRFSEQREWAENWNGGAEALTSYSRTLDASGNTVSSQVSVPDGTIHKEFFDVSATWRRGLTTGTETWAGGVKRRWTSIVWTQDDESLSYQKNPRPVEMNVYDEMNVRRRTTIQYTSFSLPTNVYQYAPDGATVLRRTQTDYRTDAAYVDRRVIGLVNSVHVWDGTGNLLSKVNRYYDEGGASSQWMENPGQVTGHDYANYGPSFAVGRGNLCWVQRFDANDPNSTQGTAIVTTSLGYNITGSVVSVRDAGDHLTSVSYADNYADGNNSRNTFAYPTSVTDAEGYTATRQYEYGLGGVTRVQTPQPNQTANVLGPVQTILYDTVGRVERVENLTNNAYTRWVYPATNNYVQTYATVQAGAGEGYAIELMDGAGRVYRAAESHPGSAGGHRAVHVVYDGMGRAVEQSKPTEIDGNWAAVGDDAAGWIYTTQSYDWMGRPRVTTLPGNHTQEAEYSSCGCAGGDVVTLRDEAGRLRRLTKDSLGRLSKVEEMASATVVYATTDYAYNGRDQLTQITQGNRIRTFQYDGHGRLQTRTTPEQGQTSYQYSADDTLYRVTDGRGATSTFAYNNRHLMTAIDYEAQGGAVQTQDVGFTYDAAGNRLGMTDGHGTMTYNYDGLSRMTWERRSFSGLGGAQFTTSYGYNLGGQLTTVENPWGSTVSYTRDHVGQVTSITGAGSVSVPTYASNIQYRAFGAVKNQTFGNNHQLQMQYDSRMRMTQWNVSGVTGTEYQYQHFGENTGRVTFARNLYDQTLDHSYNYDRQGRLISSYSGSEARAHIGQGQWGTQDGTYAHEYSYDQWNNLTQRQGWGGINASYTASFNAQNQFTQNPVTGAGMQYDAAGNLTIGGQSFQYDVTGQEVYASTYGTEQGYDGDRLRVRRVENGATTYYLRSSVLGGQVVAEMDGAGGWTRGFVYDGNGSLLAIQQGNQVEWVHQDPITKSQRLTNQSGAVTASIELEPRGSETVSSNSFRQPRKFTSYTRDANNSDDAMQRRFQVAWGRFNQPDPWDGSYDLSDPQSLNRYAYTQNDPVNNIDPDGLNMCPAEYGSCGGGGDSGSGFRGNWADDGGFFGGGGGGLGGSPMPESVAAALGAYNQRVQTSIDANRARSALNNGSFGLLQAILNGNSNIGLAVSGATFWGQDGAVVAGEFIALLAQLPESGTGYYAYGPRNEQWGALEVLATLIAFAAQWSQIHPDRPIGIGNISVMTGREQYRASHRYGYAADIRPMRNDGLREGTAWNRRDGSYNQPLTNQLLQGLMGLPGVTGIIFNDRGITHPNIIRDRTGVHDNHLHVIFRRP